MSASVFSAAAVTTRSLVQQQQQLTTSIQLLQRPGPGQWLVKCHLSLVPYTGLHWPRLHKVVPVWRLCPLWAGEQGGGRAAVWAQPPPAQSRSLSDDEQRRVLGNISSVDVLGFRLTYYKTQSLFYLQFLTIDGFI